MKGTLDAGVDLFVTKVVSRLGFGIDQQNVNHLAQVLRCCLERTGCESAEEYVERFERDREFGRKELREVVSAITVSETFFFRHPEQFDALREVVLPTLLTGREPGRELRILSAGCACGEEAYSVAAAVMKVPGIEPWKPRIRGVDINAELLQKARRGHYTEWSLRAVSEKERNGCFRREGKSYILRDALKSMVSFEERNLMDDDAAFWRTGFFDIIFCRNVMIYFSTAAVRLLAARLARCVARAGFLFLGPSETLRGISHDFHLCHTHGAFYYQRRTAAEQSTSTALRSQAPADDPGWMSSIAASGERIAALAHQSEHAQRASREAEAMQAAPEALHRSHGLEQVRELFQEERFEEALRVIDALPEKAAGDPDVLVMQAVLLVNRGELKRAEHVCGQLLVKDELRPGAHYLMAICHERRGDPAAAVESDQTAIYLDARFAMPRLHLGLVAKRLGDLATARRELGEALELLEREDAGRILLFGGGFSREALIRFCRAEWERCGGTR